ncbi:MAG: hypothetical protein JWM76_3407 [Pseudonocardiales bacterium]|nr:hypothetical protein [Pseudonocardiales bacterium]
MASSFGRPLRIATIPDNHPYISAVLPAEVDHVRFPNRRTDGTAWDPSPLLDIEHVESMLSDIDVLHVHFSYESLTPAQLRTWLDRVGRTTTALVVTVHDLRNPHHPDPEWHDAHLDALIPAAAAVITLTPGAASEINRRWNRTATVLPHPSLLPSSWDGPRPTGGSQRAGVHLKSLRRNVVDPAGVVLAAADGARRQGSTLRVDIDDAVAGSTELAPIRAAAAAGTIDLEVHPRFTDDELLNYLSEISVSILPYRFGSHSGWLEMCRDVGTTVVAPDCGLYAEQWPAAVVYANNETTGLDEESLASAVAAALNRPADPADRRERAAESANVRDAHRELYARLAVQR